MRRRAQARVSGAEHEVNELACGPYACTLPFGHSEAGESKRRRCASKMATVFQHSEKYHLRKVSHSEKYHTSLGLWVWTRLGPYRLALKAYCQVKTKVKATPLLPIRCTITHKP